MSKSKWIIISIVFFGLFLRLFGLNWDQGQHLHPDERFLTMVSTDMTVAQSIPQYLDPATSPMNPVNKGHTFYVYGTLPVVANKLLATLLLTDTYGDLTLQGRALSAVSDALIIYILFKLIELVEKKLRLSHTIKWYAAFLYAVAVLPIQLSHFFAVDTFLNMFSWASLYFAVKFAMEGEKRRVANVGWSALFLGLACACKVSALYMAPLVGLLFLIPFMQKKLRAWVPFILLSIFFGCVFYLALRLGSPYYFQTGNLLDPRISTQFISSLETLKSYDNPAIWFPPANQWVHASWYLSPLNMVVFGVGILYAVAALGGFIILAMKKNKVLRTALVYFCVFFIAQSLQYAKTMRYLLFLYPLLAVCAAVGIDFLFHSFNRLSKRLRIAAIVVCALLILWWPLAFMSIYTKNHTRVDASIWIYTHIPAHSVIAWEYWDDPLPLQVEGYTGGQYGSEQINIFDPDTREKWQKIDTQLQHTDYYIMSSNRGWGSIPKTPERYPIATRFYKDMIAGTNGFKLVKTFSSYPSLRYLGIPFDFPDQWSEEAFTVYDHPYVMIFQKTK